MRRAVHRVVLDTNVYVSAYGFGGKPKQVIEAAIVGPFVLLTSPAILQETAGKMEEVLGLEAAGVRAVLGQIARTAEVVRPTARVDVLSDGPDNRILECAVAGAADMILSGDGHLLDLGAYEGVAIVRVAAFLSDLPSE